MSRLKLPILLATTTLLAAGGYAYYGAQAATLARIAALDACLAASNQQRARAAKNTVAGISEAVRKNHNQAMDVAVLRQAQEIQDSTEALLAKLNQRRQAWQATDRDREVSMLSAQVEQYLSFIRQFTPEAPSLTKPSAQTATVGWLGEFAMATVPRPTALAQLTKLETQVRQLESEALSREARKVGSWCGFDKIGAFAIPVSKTVAPGAVYQAQMLLVQATSSGRMHFSADGREVPANLATGQGSVQFKVPAARPGQPDTVRAQWRGRVQMPWGAADTTLETTAPYLIVKPHSR